MTREKLPLGAALKEVYRGLKQLLLSPLAQDKRPPEGANTIHWAIWGYQTAMNVLVVTLPLTLLFTLAVPVVLIVSFPGRILRSLFKPRPPTLRY